MKSAVPERSIFTKINRGSCIKAAVSDIFFFVKMSFKQLYTPTVITVI